MRRLFLLFSLLLTAPLLGLAQDTIVKKNGDILRVKVTEVGTEEIRFKTFGDPESPVIVLKKSDVKKIVVSGQVIMDEKVNPVNEKTEDVLVKQDGTMLKVNVLEIGSYEVKFRLLNDPEGPIISVLKDDIRTLKVGDQIVIDNKKDTEDVILKKDGSTLKVKILELGTDVVSYKLYGSPPNSPTLSMKKKEIKSVKIDGQIVYEYKEDPYSTSNSSILDKTNSVKFHFFSPLINHLAFSYEWMNKPGFNFQAGVGIIGIGYSARDIAYGYNSNASGVFFRGGPKFLLGSASDIEVDGARIAHPLKGRYFAIEGTLHTMTRNFQADVSTYNPNNGTYTTTHYNWKNRYQSFALNLQYGRQNIYGNAVTVGYYIGFGYGFEGVSTASGTPPPNQNAYDFYDPQRYSHIFLGTNFPLTLTYGLTIGYIHRPYKQKGEKSYRNNPRAPK